MEFQVFPKSITMAAYGEIALFHRQMITPQKNMIFNSFNFGLYFISAKERNEKFLMKGDNTN